VLGHLLSVTAISANVPMTSFLKGTWPLASERMSSRLSSPKKRADPQWESRKAYSVKDSVRADGASS